MLSTGARFGLCPRCQLGAALEEDTQGQSASPPERRRRFGDYVLGSMLGRGGMGVVYQAVQLSLHRTVALKMILDSACHSPSARRRFAIEAEAAAKLDHPNIVPIYEIGEIDDQPYLTMRLVQGKSLRTLMARREIGLASQTEPAEAPTRARQEVIARLMATVARAVHHAHGHGVLHRDLKPGNILVDPDGAPHLTDFGLAKLLNENLEKEHGPLTGSDMILGTPSYMSPEQARNQRLTAAADVYSLGAVLFELLTGVPPFKANTALETVRLVTDGEPRRPSSIRRGTDPDLDTICVKCLEKNPESRFGTAQALAEELERWLRREPIQARRAGPILRLQRWVRRNPVGAGLILSLFVGLTLALALLYTSLERQRHLDLIRMNSVQKFSEEAERLWHEPGRSYFQVYHADLKALADLRPREPRPNALRLTYALSISENPVGQALRWAPWLHELEDRMSELLHRPVLFDLRLFKFRQELDRPVVRGDADFQKMGVLSFVRAKTIDPDLQPLAFEVNPREGVIFIRGDLGRSNFTQLAGLNIGFAHTNSIISFVAKVHMARSNVTARSFATSTNLDYGITMPEWVRSKGARGVDELLDFESHAHKEVIAQVLAKQLDAGVALSLHFERNKHRGPGLIEVHRFAVPYDIHVAARTVDLAVVQAFRVCFGKIQNRQTHLRHAMRGQVEGFLPATDADLNWIRAALTNELHRFNSGPAPAAR